MLRHLLIILTFLSGGLILNAQEPAINYVLKDPIPGTETRDYIARDFVSIIEGYSYTPQQSNHLLAKTDPLMVFPPDDGETGGPIPGDDGVVGAIPGSLNVAPSGAATYSVPIDVSPGISGMTPELSLLYNSGGNDGIMGPGWTVGGVSVISNVRLTEYYSDSWLGYNENSYFNFEQFALNGQRLIVQNSDDYQTAEYRLESDNFSRVIKKPWGGSGPPNGGIYFTMETKGGLKYEFGATNNSRQWVETEFFMPNKSVLNYYVNKITDRFGNDINFEYDRNTQTGEIYLTKITYGNGGEIIFNYIDRDDPQINDGSPIVTRLQHYGYDVKFMVTKRLSNIITKYGGDIYKKYGLHYIPRGTNRVMCLDNIELEGINGIKYNKTVFKWSEIPSTDYKYNKYDGQFPDSQDAGGKPYAADLNGDGLMDLIVRVTNDNVNKNDVILYKNKGNNTFQKIGFIDGDPNHSNKEIFIGDYNGDGISDLLIGFVEDLHNKYIADLYYFDPNFASTALYGVFNLNPGNSIYSVGDVDGDGLTDVITKNRETGTYGCANYGNPDKNNPFILKSPISVSDGSFLHNSIFFFADFNGSGRVDALRIANDASGTSKLFINEIDNFNGTNEIENLNYDPENRDNIIIGDYNGDFITDICIIKNNSLFSIYQGYGEGFIKTLDNKEFPEEDSWGTEKYSYFTGDFNGDYRTDIIRNHSFIRNYNIANSNLILISNDDGSDLTEINHTDFGATPIDLATTLIFDSNSDGVSDILGNVDDLLYNYSTGEFENIHSENLRIEYLHEQFNNITSVTNGLGVTTNIVYKHLLGDSRTNGENASFPIAYYPGVLTVVDNFNIAGNFYFSQTNYNYEGARVHVGGKGFLGFLKTITSKWVNVNTKTFSQTENKINPDYYYMWPQKTKTWVEVNSSRSDLSETTNLFENKEFYKSDGTQLRNFYSYLRKTITKEYDLNGTFIKVSRTDNTFNDWGDLTSSHTMTDNNPNLSLSSPETSFDYRLINTNIFMPVDDDMLENWVLGRLTTAYVTKIVPGEDDITRTSTFSYYDLTSGTDRYGLLKTETSQPWDDDWLKKEYFYDDNGNVIRTETTGSDIEKRVYRTVYDDNNRFIKNSINPLGHFDTKLYNDLTGNIKEKTDPNGLKISYKYDGFGGLTEITNPDITKTISVLRWVTENDSDAPEVSSGNPTPLYYAWAKSSGGPLKKIYYDKYGRELRRVSVGFDNKTIYSDTKYNINSTVISNSQPYFKGNTPPESMLIKYTYDDLLRPITVTEPGDRITTTTYNGLTKSVTNPEGQVNSTIHNVVGLLVSSTDANNESVTYNYYSNGKLKNIIDPKGNITTLRYDKFGNRIYLDDPDLGVNSYKYNVEGNLLNVNKANGTTAVYTYDLLGRMKTRTEDEGFTEWFYDEGDHGLGKLSLVEGPGVVEKYYYDVLGRLYQKDEVINGEMFSTKNTYDIFGRAKTFEYPSGFITKNIYDNNNYLKAVEQEDNGKILWQAKDINAEGQIKEIELGNGLSTYYDYYDETGLIKEIETPGIQFMYYTWYDIANLESRENLLVSGLKETYLYDDLNRLTTVTKNNNVTQFMDYDEIGNIITKSDVGTYKYDNPQPHAVSSIDGNHIPISSLLQDIRYTSFDKVKNINEGDNRLTIQYGISHERKMMVQTSADGTSKTKYYIGGGIYERVIEGNSEKLVHYLSAGDGLFAIYTLDRRWDNYTENGVEKSEDAEYQSSIDYVLKDHLGSIQYLTDFEGKLIEEYSYDAWGKRRDPLTWEDFSTIPTIQLDRGFTGHEHLDLFELVNMNGRIYDPVIGRFLSADPYMQMPEHTQGLNRYSYCFNNPLSHTDPSGFSVDDNAMPMLIGIIAGTIVSVATMGAGAPLAFSYVMGAFAGGFAGSACTAAMNGASFGQAMLAGLQGGGMSAILAGLTFGIGQMFTGPGELLLRDEAGKIVFNAKNILRVLGKAGSHGIVNGGYRLLQGGRFEHGMLSGLFSSLANTGTSIINNAPVGLYALIGAIAGGTAETLGGGKFANGAVTGAFVGLFNDGLHQGIVHKEMYRITTTEEVSVPGFVLQGDPGTVGKFTFHISVTKIVVGIWQNNSLLDKYNNYIVTVSSSSNLDPSMGTTIGSGKVDFYVNGEKLPRLDLVKSANRNITSVLSQNRQYVGSVEYFNIVPGSSIDIFFEGGWNFKVDGGSYPITMNGISKQIARKKIQIY